jgi:3',5'-cyclic AMP phosphodiesterase CpdA
MLASVATIRPHFFPLALALPLVALTTACTSADALDEAANRYVPAPLPVLTAAPLTTEVTLNPVTVRLAAPDARKPTDPANVAAMLGEGYGETKEGAGEGYVARTLDGGMPKAKGSNARLLVRFAHLADFQLADDESPIRLVNFDAPSGTDGAFRPQEAHECHIINALVRTVNVVHEKAPIEFVVLGGDNADNAQSNEARWVMDLLNGASSVECDSAADDDPIPGPDNDPKDPLVAEGLKMPWYWVTGNHDVLRQGNFAVTPDVVALSVGNNSVAGARDWSQAGGPILTGEVIADPQRQALFAKELYAMVAADGDGHGLTTKEVEAGKATYTFDVPGTPLRFLIVDTNAETGGANGLLRKDHVASVIEPALVAAEKDGKYVIVASHHELALLGDGSGLGGSAQGDAVMSAAYLEVLGKHPNVILNLAGHSHIHDVHPLASKAGHTWWEMVTGSLADFRHQARIVEVWDQDNGELMVRATSVDYRTDDDSVSAEGRAISTLDYTSGWGLDGNGTTGDHNVELYLPKP